MDIFFNKLTAFFKAPVFADNEEKTRRARLLHVVLVAQTYVLVLAMAGTAVSALEGLDRGFELAVMATGLILIVFWRFLMSRGMVSVPSIGMLVFFVLSISMILVSGGTIRSAGVIFFPAVVVMATLLVNRRAGIIFFVLVSLIGLFLVQGEINGIFPTPENSIGFASNVLVVAGMGLTLVLMYLATQGMDGALRRANEKEQEVREFASTLEKRVEERTKALATSAEVSRRLASILDPRQLASAVVNEVQTAFNYYYAQIYLFDEMGENLVLNAGTGDAGAEMLKRGHALPKGRGLVGRAAATKESILVSDTSQDPNWLPNELLPDTKAEAVVPIVIGGKVLGVLDVQDDVMNDIFPEDVTLLESLAGQVAISLQNADLYARAEAALQEAKSLVDYAAEGIVVLDLTTGLFSEANENATKIYGLSREELMKVGPAQVSPPTQADGRDSTEKAMEMIGIAMQAGSNIFEWNHINPQGDEFPCEIRLVRLPGDKPRLRVTVTDITERKRLQDLTAMRARQQEAINTITQKIQSTATIEEAMQVAARELGHALGKRQTVVALEPSALGSISKTLVTGNQ